MRFGIQGFCRCRDEVSRLGMFTVYELLNGGLYRGSYRGLP